ncbi:hypothetical protein SAMN05421505_1626 [Sinosporangium album]|uniref:Uncharacterized protein n=1 Tax=Sinosporangium album TaxID=504805 RepID=A0A1G8L624_9ACTN|nr:hypothetical protein SAMN05421505_1626 [Sinosporangium album]
MSRELDPRDIVGIKVTAQLDDPHDYCPGACDGGC